MVPYMAILLVVIRIGKVLRVLESFVFSMALTLISHPLGMTPIQRFRLGITA